MDDLFSCDMDDPSLGVVSNNPSSLDEGEQQGEQHLVRVEPEGDCAVLFLLVSNRPDVYYLEASDGTQTWMGSYPHSAILELAKEAKMAVGDVTIETRGALTGEQQSSAVEYSYTAIKNPTDNSLEFTWKKHLVTENVKFTLGSIVMEPCSSDDQLHSRVMNFAVSEIHRLKESIVKLRQEKNRFANERSEVLQRLEKCVNLKEELEGDLYGKFKLVLNEKKAKVRRLMDTLKRVESQGTKTATETATSVTMASVDSADEEKQSDKKTPSCTPSPVPKNKVGVATQVGDGTESSLLKDDWQTETTSPPVKRRKRTKISAAGPIEIPRPALATRTSRSKRSSSSDEPQVGSQDLINMM